MKSNKGDKLGDGRWGLSGGGHGVPWFAGVSRFGQRARRGGSAGLRARFSPGFDPLEARTLLTLPPAPHALAVSAAAAASPLIVATEIGTSPPEDQAGRMPQPVSGAFLVDGAESTASLTFDKVVQGAADTCAFDATLSAVALSNFDLGSAISVLSENSPTDIFYGVRLYQPAPGGGSEPVEVSVEYNGAIQPGDVRSTDPNEFWPTLFQRLSQPRKLTRTGLSLRG